MIQRYMALVSALALLWAAPALAEATRQSFAVPEGAGPHDVAPAPDGKVWYTAQGQGALGILDPATGQIKDAQLLLLDEDGVPHAQTREVVGRCRAGEPAADDDHVGSLGHVV